MASGNPSLGQPGLHRSLRPELHPVLRGPSGLCLGFPVWKCGDSCPCFRRWVPGSGFCGFRTGCHCSPGCPGARRGPRASEGPPPDLGVCSRRAGEGLGGARPGRRLHRSTPPSWRPLRAGGTPLPRALGDPGAGAGPRQPSTQGSPQGPCELPAASLGLRRLSFPSVKQGSGSD